MHIKSKGSKLYLFMSLKTSEGFSRLSVLLTFKTKWKNDADMPPFFTFRRCIQFKKNMHFKLNKVVNLDKSFFS